MEIIGDTMDNEVTESLEQLLKKLEKIVQSLESGKLDLDAGLVEFEKGVQIYKDCKAMLSKAEKKIKILTDELKEEDWGQ